MHIELPYVEDGKVMLKPYLSRMDQFVSKDRSVCLTNLDIQIDKVHSEAYHQLALLGPEAASLLQCRLDDTWVSWLRSKDLQRLRQSQLNTTVFVLGPGMRTVMSRLEGVQAGCQG
jgi:hypothetical protein